MMEGKRREKGNGGDKKGGERMYMGEIERTRASRWIFEEEGEKG